MERMGAGLPITSGPHDVLRAGFRSLEHETRAPHPVAGLQRSLRDAEWEGRLDMVRRIYGSHLAMRLATEKLACSRLQRQPGLEASNVNLDTVLGTQTKIGFEDFLNPPTMRPVAPVADLYTASENHAGIV